MTTYMVIEGRVFQVGLLWLEYQATDQQPAFTYTLYLAIPLVVSFATFKCFQNTPATALRPLHAILNLDESGRVHCLANPHTEQVDSPVMG